MDSPWLTPLEGSGEKFRIELESELGTTVTDGETVASVFRTMVGPKDRGWIRGGIHADGHLTLVQGMARYNWDGEKAYGLIERSAPVGNFAR